ncbi:MAG: CpsB/CapC family capsule biosynthesis tyrosine phosphatase [Acutalibacteraceae bacterium]
MGIADFHAHILPGADHGSDSLSTSLLQLRRAKAANVDEIFTTPHFYVDQNPIDKFLSRRERCFDTLQNAVIQHNIDIKLHKSAEVTLVHGLSKLPDLDKLCIENTRYMLLEMPIGVPWQPWVYSAIDELRDRGIEPILAHIERYDKKSLERIFDYDVKTQINAQSLFMGYFTRHRIESYVSGGLVHFIGSDVHMNGKHYEQLTKAVKILGRRTINRFSENARSLLNA